jgi:dolichol-phosphate mannosyltransferase
LAKGEWLVVMDADLSHPPEQISALLAPLFAGTTEIVLGSRYVRGGSAPGWPLWRRSLSRAGAAMAYPLTGVHDSMSGFFAISRSRLMEMQRFAAGFKIAFEIIIRSRPPLRVREIPIVFQDRIHGCSKMSFGIAMRFFLLWCRTVWRRLRPNARYHVGRSVRHALD